MSVSLYAQRLLAALVIGASFCANAAVPEGEAPDFTLPTIEGKNMRLQEHKGRVVLLNFWATWCGACRKELPQLNLLHTKYRASGLVVLGVNVDTDAKQAGKLAAKLGVTFPVLIDTAEKEVSKLYDLNAMPATFLIDREGQLRYLHRGYVSGYEVTYDQQIRELLKQ